MDWKNIARQVASVAEQITPFIPGTLDDSVVAAGKAALDLADKVKAIAGSSVPELETARAGLEAAVLDHLSRTEASLRGG